MPRKRKRPAATGAATSPSKKVVKKLKSIKLPPTSQQPPEKETDVQASGQMHFIISESVLNVNVTPEALLAHVPNTVRVVPFEDFTVCLHHPKPPFSRKVRVRRSKYGATSTKESGKNENSLYTWETLEVTRKFQHKAEGQRMRPSRIRQESVTSCQCSNNAQSFFESIGHTLDREFVRRGQSATIRYSNGLVEMKIFRMYQSLDDEDSDEDSPLLLELSAKVQDFQDSGGTNRSDICKNTVRSILEQCKNSVQSVCVPPGKEHYSSYSQMVSR